MEQQKTNKVGILLTGYCEDRDLIKGIIEALNTDYSHLIEFVEEGKEKLQIDISGMNAIETEIANEVEFIVKSAIKVKKYERIRDRTIKKARIETQRKYGVDRKNIN